jgi:hypothetical protein
LLILVLVVVLTRRHRVVALPHPMEMHAADTGGAGGGQASGSGSSNSSNSNNDEGQGGMSLAAYEGDDVDAEGGSNNVSTTNSVGVGAASLSAYSSSRGLLTTTTASSGNTSGNSSRSMTPTLPLSSNPVYSGSGSSSSIESHAHPNFIAQFMARRQQVGGRRPHRHSIGGIDTTRRTSPLVNADTAAPHAQESALSMAAAAATTTAIAAAESSSSSPQPVLIRATGQHEVLRAGTPEPFDVVGGVGMGGSSAETATTWQLHLLSLLVQVSKRKNQEEWSCGVQKGVWTDGSHQQAFSFLFFLSFFLSFFFFFFFYFFF